MIVRVRLVDHNIDSEYEFHHRIAYYTRFLNHACPGLKSLTTDLRIVSTQIWKWEKESYASYQLKKLWPRLNYLRLEIKYHSSKVIRPHLKWIAPGLRWSWLKNLEPKDTKHYSWGGKVFFIDRDHLEKGDTEIEDETPLNSDDDSSIDTTARDSDAEEDMPCVGLIDLDRWDEIERDYEYE